MKRQEYFNNPDHFAHLSIRLLTRIACLILAVVVRYGPFFTTD
jgi:hypothetical protein